MRSDFKLTKYKKNKNNFLNQKYFPDFPFCTDPYMHL